MEYIYILKNKSYAPYVVKIGRTSVCPQIRSKQIYWGATGVPESFQVMFSCEVPDSTLAEKRVHKVLSAYRKNNRREFFYLPIENAKQVVLDVCQHVFGEEMVRIVINDLQDSTVENVCEETKLDSFSVNISQLLVSPLDTSTLTLEQVMRLSIIRSVFTEVYPCTQEKILDNFSRDKNPEQGIETWEFMAKAFMKVSTNELITKEFQKEAFSLILSRSTSSKTNVLKNRSSVGISNAIAKKILDAYELKPRPLVVEKVV